MSMYYSAVALRNPQKPDEPYRYYARSQTKEIVKLNKLVEKIARGRTLTDVEIYGVIRALIQAIKVNLADGKCIDLEDLGRFRYVISSDGAITYDACKEHYIKDVKLQFKPAAFIKPNMKDLEFEKVLPKKAQEEAKQNYRETQQP
ncbi:MAG: hypothetical protein LUG18_06355 [Candidatus Azobacteroides sp.]|nr:hypothetical protein [Candidatus Azobacteroides sp.]